MMNYVPGVGVVHATPAEISAARRAAGNAAKAARKKREWSEGALEKMREVGRRSCLARKGVPQKSNPYPGEERVFVRMLVSARETFAKCAVADNKTIIMFLADYAQSLRSDPRYAGLFAADGDGESM